MKEVNIAIVGSRTYPTDIRNIQSVADTINTYLKENELFVNKIVSGGAKGADYIAEQVYHKRLVEAEGLAIHPADWNRLGKSAGYIRNKLIEEDADICFAFVDKPLHESRGTAGCVKLFEKSKKKVFVFRMDQ